MTIIHFSNPNFHFYFYRIFTSLTLFYFMKKLTLTEHPIRFGCGAAFHSSYGTCIATNSHITDLLSSKPFDDVVIY